MPAVLTENLIYEILSAVEEIPEGKVASYGQIAKLIGRDKNARLVGRVLSMAEYYGQYPCHRVVNQEGRLAPHFSEQRSLLLEEKVEFKDSAHVDMKKCQWMLDEREKKENKTEYIHHYESPLGGITLASDKDSITGLWFDGQKYFGSTLCPEHEQKALPVFKEAERWLDIYFGGKVPDFTPPLSLKGTSFRKAVWKILLTIPYGSTMTYKEIGNRIAKLNGLETMSSQAVGGAVGHNPISIIIPCHRVIGTDGSLTGYAGGIDKKQELLKREGAVWGKKRD